MLDLLLDSPAALAAAIAIVSLLNYAIGASALRGYSRQNFIESAAYLPGSLGMARPGPARLTWPFFLAAMAISLTLSADPTTREIFGGGYLVMLAAGLALNITSLLTVRALIKPAAAEGRVHFSAAYHYRSAGAQSLGFALFSVTVGILFGSLAFMAGSFFLLVSAIGYYRRARRATRTAVQASNSGL
jgi:hypothetical protein